MSAIKKIPMTAKVIICMILGYICGVLIGAPLVKPFTIIGTMFTNLLLITCVPFVLCSITLSVSRMDDIKRMGRIGGKVCGLYVLTTIIGCIVAYFAVTLIGPGRGFEMLVEGVTDRTAAAPPTIESTLLNLIPKNIFSSLNDMNLMQIIVFAIFLGACLSMLGEKKKAVVGALDTLCEAMIGMMRIAMKTVPVGVFALMYTTGAAYGPSALKTVGKVLLADYITFLFILFVVYGAMLALRKLNIFTFVKKASGVIASALSTTSSNATLPLTIEAGVDKMGIPSEIASFSLPLGATVNLNGCAANIIVCVLFSCQVYGINLSFSQIVTLIVITTITAIGVAGVPGGAIAFTLAILAQFGIPIGAYALVLGVYRIIDMGMTTVNIVGDLACTTVVCDGEKILDRSKWNQ